MKPLGLVQGDCEAYGDVSTCVQSKFLSGLGGWAGFVESWRGKMFEMRWPWWGKGVIIKISFIKQFQGGSKGKDYVYGGKGS